MPVLIGTSGWHYDDWKGPVYPAGLPKRDWLAHLAGIFPTVELNNSFYRLPPRTSFESWARQVPDGFVFAVKASRYITHIKRLRDVADSVALLMERVAGLGDRCGPILLQLPPNLPADVDALDGALRAFPRAQRVAVEMRHPTWDRPEVRRVLERHSAGCCWADRRGPLSPEWKTADWGYVRFHEGRAAPAMCYGRQALSTAAEKLRASFGRGEDLYVYFNNDPHGCAVRNGRSLAALMDADNT